LEEIFLKKFNIFENNIISVELAKVLGYLSKFMRQYNEAYKIKPHFLLHWILFMYFGHVRFHVDFLSNAICLGCCLKLPYCKPKARAQGIMNQ
jgi:hypothetical protein